MKKHVKLFVIEIEIQEDQWFILPNKQPKYKKGQRIMIPIKTSSVYHAELKFLNNYWGSEMPPYKFIKTHECDNGGFYAADRFFDWK